MLFNGEEVRLSDLSLEILLLLWSREELDDHFGKIPEHADAPTRVELDAAIAAANELPWPDDNEDGPDSDGWTDLSDEEIKAVVRAIVRSCSSDEEVKRRVAAELDFQVVAITSHTPTDRVGREARCLVAALGGLIRADGAMVMITVYGRGKMFSI